jgi:hypothetical protein
MMCRSLPHPGSSSGVGTQTLVSLVSELCHTKGLDQDLAVVLQQLATALKQIRYVMDSSTTLATASMPGNQCRCACDSFVVRRAAISNLTGSLASVNTGGEKQKKLDVVAVRPSLDSLPRAPLLTNGRWYFCCQNELIKAAMRDCQEMGVMASEEEDGAIQLRVGRSIRIPLNQCFGPRDSFAAGGGKVRPCCRPVGRVLEH